MRKDKIFDKNWFIKYGLQNLSQSDKAKIEWFYDWLFTNAPTNNGLYFPYKPYIIISLLKNMPNFNKTINLSDGVYKEYFNSIAQDPVVRQAKYKNLTKWCELYDKGICDLQMARAHIIKNPLQLKYTKRKGKQVNRKPVVIFNFINNKQIEWLIEEPKDENQWKKIKCLLINLAVSCVEQKCKYIPYIGEKLNPNNAILRIHQRQWSSIIRNQFKNKCFICENSLDELLESAHIKPYSKCCGDEEKYSPWNGILLCANHHKFFDHCLRLKKEGEEYVFYLKPGIYHDETIDKIINIFRNKINQLVLLHPEYREFFDFLSSNPII